MSDSAKKFEASYLNAGAIDSSEENSAEAVKPFTLNELVAGSETGKSAFVYDSESAGNFDRTKIKRAKEGVKEILSDAFNQIKAQSLQIKGDARKEGFDTGYREGFEKGEQAAREEFAPFLETLQKSIEELSGFRKMMHGKLEREMIELVVELTKKIVQFELATREDSIQNMIHLAVQSVLDRESLVIKVHPVDQGYAEKYRPELKKMFGEINNISIEANSGIERGGCVIESNFGAIDAQISQLNEQMDKILRLAPPPPEDASSESSP